jgi:hypothetical protein
MAAVRKFHSLLLRRRKIKNAGSWLTKFGTEIIEGRLRRLGYVERMQEEETLKKILKNSAEGKRSVEKPRNRWLDEIENDLIKMGVRDLRNMVKN